MRFILAQQSEIKHSLFYGTHGEVERSSSGCYFSMSLKEFPGISHLLTQKEISKCAEAGFLRISEDRGFEIIFKFLALVQADVVTLQKEVSDLQYEVRNLPQR